MGSAEEKKVHWPKSAYADLWILIWEEVRRIHQEGSLPEVEHVKAHRSSWRSSHDMVRRVDPHGEAFVWCRKCSGYVRCRLGATLRKRCRLAKEGHEKAWENIENIAQNSLQILLTISW